MIITRTPLRVSLFGGGTDYENFYSRYGSLLIGFTINKYYFVSVKKNPKFFDYRLRITYSKVESINDKAEIENPGVRGTLQYFDMHDPLSIGIQGDLPARTGLGSSSAMVVGLCKAIDVYKQQMSTKKELATHAIAVERKVLAEPGGIQDQIWAAYGGINSIAIDILGNFQVRPLPVSEEFLEKFHSRIILCHTGYSRNSFEIAASHDKNLESMAIKKQLLHYAHMGLNAFEMENVDEIGWCLHRSWQLKKSVSTGISNEFIDRKYNEGLEAGALGGKLLGAGGSGFLFFVLKDGVDKDEFSAKIGLNYVDFDFARNGSEVILNEL